MAATSSIMTTGSASGASVREMALFTADTITLMGLSFVMGVLCTTLILLIFDFMRRNHRD